MAPNTLEKQAIPCDDQTLSPPKRCAQCNRFSHTASARRNSTDSRPNYGFVKTILLLLSALLSFALGGVARAEENALPDQTREVPAGARVSLEADKTGWFLGENIVVHFKVENTGDTPFSISSGGDYRGGTRSNRFKISARDTAGHLVPDPDPVQRSMGGMVGSQTLAPGQTWYETLSLLAFCRFEAPGDYNVSASHDLGWQATPARPLPIATLKIRLKMPSPEEARTIVEALEKMPPNSGVLVGTKNTQPWPDYYSLRFPVYLPLLAPKLRAGDARFLPSIAELETPDATRLLIELLNSPPPLSRLAAQALSERLPFDAKSPERRLGIATTQEQQAALKLREERVESSWRPEFRAPVLTYARHALQSDDRDTLRLATSLVESLGQHFDLPLVLSALDKRLEQTALRPRWQFIGQEEGTVDLEGWQLQDDCLGLIHAAQTLVRRGAVLPDGNRASLLAVRIEAVRRQPQAMKTAHAQEAASLMHHRLPFIRQLALESQMPTYSPPGQPPAPLSPLVLAQLPAMLNDPDISVRSAACELIGFTPPASSLRAPLLRALRQVRNNWDAGDANHAAQTLGASYEAAQIWASRLDEPKMFYVAMSSLIDLTTGHGFSGRTDTPPQGALFKAHWQKFLSDNANLLRSGKKVESSRLPADLLPGGWNT